MTIRMMSLMIGLGVGVSGCTGTGNDLMSGLLNEMKAVPPMVAYTPAKTDDPHNQLAKLQQERQQLADALAAEQGQRIAAERELARLRDQARGMDAQSARLDDLERQLADRNGQLARLGQSGDESDRAKRQVSELTLVMSERDQEIASLKELSHKSEIGADELSRANQQIGILKGNVSERDQEIGRLTGLMNLNRGDAEELGRVKQQVAALSDGVSERDQEIVRLKGLLDQQKISKAEKDLVTLLQPEISKGTVSVHQLDDLLKISLAPGILFDSGKAELKPAGVDVIKRVGGVLKEFPDKRVHVDGYTDNVPIRGALLKTFPSNMDLSKARAENAMSALEHGGVPKANMTAIGHADTEPVANNNTATGRQKNRRVEIVVQ